MRSQRSSRLRRVENNSTRQQYRILTDNETEQIAAIKQLGQELIDGIEHVAELAYDFCAELTDQLDPEIDASQIAVLRAVESTGAVVTHDPDGGADVSIAFPEQRDQIIKVQESVMWAVRSLTG